MTAPVAVEPAVAAEMLDVSERTVYRLMGDGTLPYVQLTSRIRRIPVAAIHALLGQVA